MLLKDYDAVTQADLIEMFYTYIIDVQNELQAISEYSYTESLKLKDREERNLLITETTKLLNDKAIDVIFAKTNYYTFLSRLVEANNLKRGIL